MNEDDYLLQHSNSRELLHDAAHILDGTSAIDSVHESRGRSTYNPQCLVEQQQEEKDCNSGVLYVSALKNGSTGGGGKTRNGYQRYDSLPCHHPTSHIEEEVEDLMVVEESSCVLNEDEDTSSSISQGNANVILTTDPTTHLSNMSTTSNELRQRVSVTNSNSNNSSNNNNNMDNRTRFNIHQGLYSNRVRSFTSPDTTTTSPPRYNHANNRIIPSFFTASSSSEIDPTTTATTTTAANTTISPQRSLLNSLDSGMTALRRWMVNRASQSVVGTSASNSRPSRATQVVQMQINDEECNYNHSSQPSTIGGVGVGVGGYEQYVASLTSEDRPMPSLSSLSYHGSIHSGTSDEYLYSMGLLPQSSYDGTAVLHSQTIHEEEEEHPLRRRQRANSEPERSRWTSLLLNRRRSRGGARDRMVYPPPPPPPPPPQHLYGNRERWMMNHHQQQEQRQQRESLVSGGNSLPSEMIFDLESNSERLNRVSFRIGSQSSLSSVAVDDNAGGSAAAAAGGGIEMPSQRSGNVTSGAAIASTSQLEGNIDPLREARRNWIRINRIFKVVVTVVGLIFSFLLFSIMVTWVVLTSAYVVSIDEVCDVPLKTYFWLATIQLMLDVFRKEIMRFVFRFDPSRNREQIPTRVIFYNLAYLTYAMLVLRLGITSIFLSEGSQCPHTAKKLFNTTRIFVSITIAAWLLVLFGYLIPFCIVAILLTRNGYSPAVEQNQGSTRQNYGVFPLSHVHNGAPPSCIDRMKSLTVEEFRDDFPRECCVSQVTVESKVYSCSFSTLHQAFFCAVCFSHRFV